MKLVIDGSNIISGGGLTHLIELLRYNTPLKYGFTIVLVWAPDKTLRKIKRKDWLIKKSHPYLNKGYFARYVWKKFILKNSLNDTDVIFIPGTGYISCSCKVITMCRNLLPLEIQETNRYFPSLIWVRLLLLRFLHLKTFKKANGIIFLNEYCYNKVYELTGSITDHTIIPHGVNSRFKKEKRSFKIDKKFNLLYVSTLDLYKHQWKIAEAVLNLKKQGFPIELTLIGDAFANTEEKLNNILAEYPKEQHYVKWLGKVPYNQLQKYYEKADAFIYGSTCETFGMTLLEAMAASLPVACSNKSSMKNMLEEAGIYFDPENVPSIENAILKLFHSRKLREELGKKSHNLAMKYDWKITADKTFKYLSEIAFY